MSATTKAHLALLGTNIFFAINFTTVKLLINQGLIQPFGLNLVRVTLSAALLWILYFFNKEKIKIQKKHYGRFFICALSGIAINQLLFIKGLSLTYSIHASLLMLATPIFVTLLAAWILKSKLTKNKWLGLLLGITGATIIIASAGHGVDGSNIFLGDVFIIINAISYAFYFIWVQPLMKIYPPIMVIRIIFTLGFFLMLPFCLSEFLETPWHNYQPSHWGLLFLIIFCGTFLAYIFNVFGIKILGPGVAGSYIYTQPVFAAIVAMIVLKEELDFYKIIAALCIAAGVYLSTKNEIEIKNV